MEWIPWQGARLRRVLLAVAAACVIAAALPALAMAAPIHVNTEADNDGAGCAGAPNDCSLRQAIATAAAGDVIDLPAGHYTLDSSKGTLYVDKNLTIQGTGNPVVDGGGAVGVFSIGGNGQPFPFAFPEVTVDGVTVTGGLDATNGGGGFVVYGSLILKNSTVRDNKSIYTGGGISLSGTEGGSGTLRVENSTISGNQADDQNFGGGGGGIYSNGGAVTVVQSTITGNTVGLADDTGEHSGGGIYSRPSFGEGSGLSIYNSTVVGNSVLGTKGSGGNIWSGDSPVDEVASFVVLAGFAGPDPGIRMQNTIVTGGSANDGPNCGGATPTSLGFNAVPSGQCGAAGSDVSGDPKLGPLGSNGGLTKTMKLLPGSAAIDAGDPTGCKDDALAALSPDQRTQPRPQGGRCDIGAVEFAPPKAVTSEPGSVTTTSATINGTATNPHIAAGTSHFEFGTSTAYGTTIDTGSVASGASGDPRSAGVSGLSPNTTYHYRMVVQNDDDTSFGPDVSFRTPTPGADPEPQPEPEPEPEPKPDPKPKKPTIRAARAGAGCVRSRFSARLSIHVASSMKLRSVHVMLDGKLVRTTKRKRFSVHLNTRKLSPGTHVLRVVATDSGGRKTSIRRLFRRCRPPAQPAFTG